MTRVPAPIPNEPLTKPPCCRSLFFSYFFFFLSPPEPLNYTNEQAQGMDPSLTGRSGAGALQLLVERAVPYGIVVYRVRAGGRSGPVVHSAVHSDIPHLDKLEANNKPLLYKYLNTHMRYKQHTDTSALSPFFPFFLLCFTRTSHPFLP